MYDSLAGCVSLEIPYSKYSTLRLLTVRTFPVTHQTVVYSICKDSVIYRMVQGISHMNYYILCAQVVLPCMLFSKKVDNSSGGLFLT